MRKQPEKTAQTKADFTEAFWRLYAQQPFESITVQQLCTMAGYTRGTFYLHFHDLPELKQSIENAYLDSMTACVDTCLQAISKHSTPLGRLAALKDVVSYYEQHREHITVLLGTKADPAFIVRLKNNLKPLWRTYVVTDTGAHTEQEIDLMLEFTLTGTLFMISLWLKNPGDVSVAQIGRLVYDTAIRDVTRRAAAN